MDDILLIAAATFVPFLYAAIFFHELGHAIAGRLSGHCVTSFGIFPGGRCISFRLRDVIVYFGLPGIFAGVTFSYHRRIFPSRLQGAVLLSGGIAANLTVANVALVAGLLLLLERMPFSFLPASMP